MHFFKNVRPLYFLQLLISCENTFQNFQNLYFLLSKTYFLVFQKTKKRWKKLFLRFWVKTTVFDNVLNFIILLIPDLVYKSVLTFFLKAIERKIWGGKKCHFGPFWDYLPPSNFFSITVSKKVKTLLYSILGVRSMIKLRKWSKNVFFPQNLKKYFFGHFWVFWKTKKCDFDGKK